jgi:hypothetical protein
LENLAEIVSTGLARLSGMPGDQNHIDQVGPIEGSFISGIGAAAEAKVRDAYNARNVSVLTPVRCASCPERMKYPSARRV